VKTLLTNKIINILASRYGEGVREDVALFFNDSFNISELFNIRTFFSNQRPKLGNKDGEGVSLWGSYLSDDSPGPFIDACPQSRVFFVNGILTPFGLADYQRNYLANLIHQPVGLLYNPTVGLLGDLLECHQDRQGKPSDVVMALYHQLQTALNTNGDITLVGYSQGAIIATHALQLLARHASRDELRRIHYTTFGAGFKDSLLPHCIHQEHFANARDPITHLGLHHPDFSVTGEIHSRDAHGHMLVADYLSPTLLSEFSNFHQSHFSTLLHPTHRTNLVEPEPQSESNIIEGNTVFERSAT
jgi:hypothetical protein